MKKICVKLSDDDHNTLKRATRNAGMKFHRRITLQEAIAALIHTLKPLDFISINDFCVAIEQAEKEKRSEGTKNPS